MGGIFSTLHHVCIVVRDASATAAYYASVGIGPWHAYPPLTDYVDLDVPDTDAFLHLTYMYANLGNVQIQLCQPGPQDSPQRRFLEARGEGIFHLGFDVPSCDDGETKGLAAGLLPLMKGRRRDRSGFTYFDTAAQAGGVVLEIRSSPLPADPKI